MKSNLFVGLSGSISLSRYSWSMANRLAHSLSPYLLQHKDNPIDWFPWGEEAWSKAKSEGKPVFLSIGYSSCHWCHVMAHESFEDEEVAAILNRDFVSIKLDREERPDIDEVYMTAVQMATGHGGWPMSLFLTPDKKPFFAGTYFPKQTKGEFPGFLTIVGSLATAWKEQAADVTKAADEFATALSAALERTLPTDVLALNVGLIDQAVDILHQDFDFDHGGFGCSPKFPPHSAIRFLLDYASSRDSLGEGAGDLPERAGHMALATLEHIVLGGIYDHVGGGIHRYSTDDHWLLPHFEKTLYDNAQIVGALHHATELTTDERLADLFTRRLEHTVDWILADLATAEGLFMCALDADSEGREGAYYLWKKSEIDAVLDNSTRFCAAYCVMPEGNFLDEATGARSGENVLALEEDDQGEWTAELRALGRVRSAREAPGLDNKALASWNGLMISSLAQSGYLDAALTCAKRWRSFGADVPHMIVDGQPSGTAFLDDLAFLADAFLDLVEASGEAEWRQAAEVLAEKIVSDFSDPGGAFTSVSKKSETLFGRTKPYMDNATPSPIGTSCRVLRRLGRTKECLQALSSGLGWIQRAPRATDTLLRECLHLLWQPEGTAYILKSAEPKGGLLARLDPADVIEDEESWGHTDVVVSVPAGLHINSHEPLAKWLTPTSLSVEGAFAEAAFPETMEGIYKGETRIPVRLRRQAESGQFTIVLKAQVCSDSECFMPVEIELGGRLLKA